MDSLFGCHFSICSLLGLTIRTKALKMERQIFFTIKQTTKGCRLLRYFTIFIRTCKFAMFLSNWSSTTAPCSAFDLTCRCLLLCVSSWSCFTLSSSRERAIPIQREAIVKRYCQFSLLQFQYSVFMASPSLFLGITNSKCFFFLKAIIGFKSSSWRTIFNLKSTLIRLWFWWGHFHQHRQHWWQKANFLLILIELEIPMFFNAASRSSLRSPPLVSADYWLIPQPPNL